MKHRIILSLIMILNIFQCVAYDHIIFRNGKELDVKLYQINDNKIVFGYIGDKSNTLHEVPSKEVYMVYIEKQGNIYITKEGKRITGEYKPANAKQNDVIYLVKGMEIAANDIKITENNILYSTKSGFLKKGAAYEPILAKSEVFMIRYRSGMVDIITPIDIIEEQSVEEIVIDQKQPEYVVIFHAVKEGENLEIISSKYDTTPEKIIEWNELSSRIKTNTPLTEGMQLLIYQRK